MGAVPEERCDALHVGSNQTRRATPRDATLCMQMVLLQGRHESRTSRRYDDVMSRESLQTDMRPESVDCKSLDTV